MAPWRLLALVTLGASLCLPVSAQSRFSVLYGFSGQGGDGAAPNGILAIGKDGVLYGTTASGGSGPCALQEVPSGCGTVFALQPPTVSGGAWTERMLYRFAGANGDGWSPYGGVVIGSSGRLYGTTLYGGTGCGTYGCGTVFELTPPKAAGEGWTETVLYRFTGENGDGAAPVGGLARFQNGDLYGLTAFGGLSGYGTIYRLAPPAVAGEAWNLTILHSFAVPSFSDPQGYPADMGLTIGEDGALYGATPLGGLTGDGMVFRVVPPRAPGGILEETELYSFIYPHGDGDFPGPEGGVTAGARGVLYGSTYTGGDTALCAGDISCGTVFELKPPAIVGGTWQETVICNLGSPSCGVYTLFPDTNVVVDRNGVLYGAGLYDLFRLQPPAVSGGAWSFSTIYNFNGGSAGVEPSGLAMRADGILFGTTMQGGLCNYCGAVFSWAPPGR
ncbi:MAG TPA: choice-of-anchor tandem repeat GloVer-containing protein [Bryobacteraceae bacterium]|jgi:uncharacterized repeat protein (TIGR03803 family)|nr:choice-of-anchor tandem repeat GloVer-containing protein [Bryobacteraceae bacterium]